MARSIYVNLSINHTKYASPRSFISDVLRQPLFGFMSKYISLPRKISTNRIRNYELTVSMTLRYIH